YDPVHLVPGLQCFKRNNSQQGVLSGFREKSNAVGFIVAWPQGVGNSWNAFGCCGTADSQNIDDPAFLRAVVGRISQLGSIDPKRVYITGLSNGGFITHPIAFVAGGIFSAAAPVSAPLHT